MHMLVIALYNMHYNTNYTFIIIGSAGIMGSAQKTLMRESHQTEKTKTIYRYGQEEEIKMANTGS